MCDYSTVRPKRQYFSGLWRHPAFMKLWIGQSISAFGSRITRDGLPLAAILVFGATPVQMGLLSAVSALPGLLLGLIIGAWADRLPRRPLMLAADLGRMMLLLTIPLAAVAGHLSLILLVLVATLTSALGLIFDIAYQSFLPVLVSREHVLEGNSKLATTESLAEIGGPTLAGLMIQTITAPLAIAFDALSFLLSAISLALIQIDEPRPTAEENGSPGTTLLTEIKEGLRVVAHDRLLRALIVFASARAFFGSFYGTLYSLYVIRDLGLTPVVLGLLIGAGGVGSLIGATAAPSMVRRFGLGQVMSGILRISPLISLLTPLAGGPLLLAAGMLIAAQLVGDSMMTIYGINELSIRQSVVGNDLLGRTNATFDFFTRAVMPVGALIAGLLATMFSARIALSVTVLGNLAVAWLVLRSPLPQAQVKHLTD